MPYGHISNNCYEMKDYKKDKQKKQKIISIIIMS